MTDLGGDYQNLYKLIYSDISSDHTRNDILEHFKREVRREWDFAEYRQ